MEEVRKLSDLEQMIGKENVRRCLKEYLRTIIVQSKKYEDLQSNCAVMDDDEMWKFIESIGRTELYEELEEIKCGRQPSSRYLKAIRVSLVEQGYDERWVDTTFRDALEKYYYEKKLETLPPEPDQIIDDYMEQQLEMAEIEYSKVDQLLKRADCAEGRSFASTSQYDIMAFYPSFWEWAKNKPSCLSDVSDLCSLNSEYGLPAGILVYILATMNDKPHSTLLYYKGEACELKYLLPKLQYRNDDILDTLNTNEECVAFIQKEGNETKLLLAPFWCNRPKEITAAWFNNPL